MRKKFIVALATSLVLANGVTAAFADDGSDHSTTTTSTTVTPTTSTTVTPTTSTTVTPTTSTTVADGDKSDRSALKEQHEAIMATFRASMASARETFATARKSATTKDERKAAEVAFTNAVKIATQVKTDALKALDGLTAEPKVTEDQKATFKADLTTFLEARKTIRTNFNTAIADAQKAFKTARGAATTNADRKAAREAFLTASKVARQTYQNALKALGTPPAKPKAAAGTK